MKKYMAILAAIIIAVIVVVSGTFAADRGYFITHTGLTTSNGLAFGNSYTVTLQRRLGKDRAVYRTTSIDDAMRVMREMEAGYAK